MSCVWNIQNINSGYYDATISINIADITGNSVTDTVTARVLDVKADNSTPNLLTIENGKVTPSTVNRIALDLANQNGISYFVYDQYRITPKTARTKLNYQKIDNCVYQSTDGKIIPWDIFSDIVIADPYAKINDVDRIDLVFDPHVIVNDLPDSFVAYCNISAYLSEDTFVYKKPQHLVVKIPIILRNSKIGTPGKAIQDKIAREEDGFIYNLEILGIANKWIPKMQKICQIKSYFEAGSVAANIITSVGKLITPIVGPGVATGGQQFAVNIDGIANCFYGDRRTSNVGYAADVKTAAGSASTSGSFDIGPCTDVIRTICDFLSCNVASEIQKKGTLTNIFNSTDLKDNGILKNADIPDVSNSLVAAVTHECYPAIVYNINKWRQLQCSYVFCLKETSVRGTDISVCDQAKGIQTCSLVVGEVFEDIPPVRYFKNVVGNIGDIINNIGPLTAVSLAKIGPCKEFMDPSIGPSPVFEDAKLYWCQFPLTLARFVDGLKRTTRAQGFTYPEVPDMCEMAKCAGQPNCKDEPNIWTTLNKINIPPPSSTGRDYAFVTEHSKKETAARDKRQNLVEEQKTLTDSYGYDPEVNSFPDVASRINDINTEIKNLDKTIDKEHYLVKCGSPSCNFGINGETVLNSKGEPVKIADLSNDQKRQINAEKMRTIEDVRSLQEEFAKGRLTDKDKQEKLNAINADLNKYSMPKCSIGSTGNLDCPLSKEQIAQIEKEKSEYDTAYKAKQLGDGIYLALQALYSNHVLDWMMAGNWAPGIMKVVKYFDAEEWKSSACNPVVQQLGGNSGDTGSVISCTQGTCQPVLTMAAERQYIRLQNGTSYYLYTVAYYIGPISLPSGKTLPFNLEYKGDTNVIGYIATKPVLRNNEVAHANKAFAITKKLTKICIRFDGEFPPNSQTSSDLYCRDIKESDYDTGSPVSLGNSLGYGSPYPIAPSGGNTGRGVME
jgi:hypothetical protein